MALNWHSDILNKCEPRFTPVQVRIHHSNGKVTEVAAEAAVVPFFSLLRFVIDTMLKSVKYYQLIIKRCDTNLVKMAVYDLRHSTLSENPWLFTTSHLVYLW